MSEYALVPLYGRDGIRAYAKVDAADAEAIGRRRWNLHPEGYAVSSEWVDGRIRAVRMHRSLLGLNRGDARQGDHINGDRLDNRRANLRIVTNAENCQNLTTRGPSRFRGVHFHPQTGKWRVIVRENGRKKWLGQFDSEEEAGRTAADWRREYMPFSREAREQQTAEVSGY